MALNEIKVLRDPIHGYIHISDDIVWELIDTKEFQRLRRIKQLGGAYIAYHTAEHSRFAHSLGVYEIVSKMLSVVPDLKESLTEHEKLVVKLAGLLHDIGHYPFSHAFEAITPINHEQMTVNIIMGPSSINDVLNKYDRSLPDEIASIIQKKHPNKILNQLISSQLDADRMDYLLRDAYFTGTAYGTFDLARLLRTFRVKKGTLVIKESGIHSVEDFILARYHMYWQVYYHPIGRSYEKLLLALFTRMKDVYNEHKDYFNELKMFDFYLNNREITNEEHYELDDCAVLYGFRLLTKTNDTILNDLSNRILSRDLFKYEDISNLEQIKNKENELIKHGYDPKYYLFQDDTIQRPYIPFSKANSIMIEVNDDVVDVSDASVIVKALTQAEVQHDSKMYFPIIK